MAKMRLRQVSAFPRYLEVYLLYLQHAVHESGLGNEGTGLGIL